MLLAAMQVPVHNSVIAVAAGYSWLLPAGRNVEMVTNMPTQYLNTLFMLLSTGHIDTDRPKL